MSQRAAMPTLAINTPETEFEKLALDMFLAKRETILIDPNHEYGLTPPHSRIAITTFSDYQRRFVHSINLNFITLLRHIRDLKAWSEIEGELANGKAWAQVQMDFIDPLLTTASDMPHSIKDQMVQASVILERLATEPETSVVETIKLEQSHGGWVNRFKALESQAKSFEKLKESIDVLWHEPSGRYLQNRHGRRQHGVSESLLSLTPEIRADNAGAIVFGWAHTMKLSKELAVIEEQLPKLYNAYLCFCAYGTELEDILIDRAPFLHKEQTTREQEGKGFF